MTKLDVDELLIQVMNLKMNDFGKFLDGFSKEIMFMSVFTPEEDEKKLLINASESLNKIADKIKD
jgi:hypothetical protein